MTGSLLILFLCVRDSRENPWNYRAVSPMSVEGKRLETILWDRIYSHLEEVGLIGNSQHGFVHGCLCHTNLTSFLSRW